KRSYPAKVGVFPRKSGIFIKIDRVGATGAPKPGFGRGARLCPKITIRPVALFLNPRRRALEAIPYP
ncbi:MAG: hypothetical protein ACEQSU_17400, partial [Microgenomates group bacterium]